MTIETISAWIKATQLSALVTETAWVWPVLQTVHFFGLVMLIGMALLLDLRILGFGKGLRPGGIHSMMRIGIIGFVLNILTGIGFLAGDPEHFLGNPAFAAKMAFLAAAGTNVLLFYATGLGRKVDAMEPEDDAPAGAKFIAVTSLVTWAGVMYCGRMLPYLGDSF